MMIVYNFDNFELCESLSPTAGVHKWSETLR